MGTSQSSNGSPSGVPMVPPWVPAIESATFAIDTIDSDQPVVTEETGNPSSDSIRDSDLNSGFQNNLIIAPAGRFGNTRRSLGDFARSGNSTSMRRAVGRYVQGGYGGSGTATKRFGGTARTSEALYSALGGTSAGNTGTAAQGNVKPLNLALTTSGSVDDIMDAVVEAVRPIDGTQDTEASRAAIKDALAELLTQFPEADLTSLEEQQREFVVEQYVAADVFRRFDLDVGKAIKDKAPSATAAMSRLKEVRDYIKETISAAFRNLRQVGQKLAAGKIAQIVQSALHEAFTVFEDYDQ